MKDYIAKLVAENHHGKDEMSDGEVLDCVYAILDESAFTNDQKVDTIRELLHNWSLS